LHRRAVEVAKMPLIENIKDGIERSPIGPGLLYPTRTGSMRSKTTHRKSIRKVG
jgi:hypothetical protein